MSLLASHKSFSDEARNDLAQTTTGVGHAYREPVHVPPLSHKRQLDPLPHSLTEPPSNPVLVEDVYTSTSKDHHRPQPMGTLLDHPVHKKAPGHWGVHYNWQMASKLNEKPQRRALTMGNQSSETKAQFSSSAVSDADYPKDRDHRPPQLSHHLEGGPTKELVATTNSPHLRGVLHHGNHPSALSSDDPYISTSHYHHRTFSSEEINSQSKKDATTYWGWEGQPKAWGYSTEGSGKPRPPVEKEEVMRDRTWFATATSSQLAPTKAAIVPNKGLCSVYQESYQEGTSATSIEMTSTVAPPPPLETMTMGVTARDLLEATPQMYKTTNSSYGEDFAVVS